MALDIELPIEAINDIAQSGNNENLVKYWCLELNLYSSIKRREALSSVIDIGTHSHNEIRNMTTKRLIEIAVWDTAWYQAEIR